MKYINLFILIYFICISKIYTQAIQTGTGEISLIGSGTYTQNFDSLQNSGSTGNTLPYGWYFSEGGDNKDSTYGINNGSTNAGNTYSYGTTGSTDRALGCLRSGALVPTIGAKLYNNTGFTITQIPITYTGEMWRLGQTGRNDTLQFQYSTDATSLNDGNWISVQELNFITPDNTGSAGARDGNNSQYRTTISYTITGLNIPNGSYFWIKWVDINTSGADDGLAIDDFSIDQTALPVQLTSFNAIIMNKKVKLTWSTSTEVNNYGFEIERQKLSPTGKAIEETNWKTIGFIQGNGNSNVPRIYTYTDRDITNGKYAYRLKQIDYDGKYEYSKTVEIDVKLRAEDIELVAYPNPFNPETKIKYSIPDGIENANVQVKLYDGVGREIKTLYTGTQEPGVYELELNGDELTSGIYFVRLNVNEKYKMVKTILIK